MPKVLVTGGAGFIGSHIVDLLIENDYEVVIIDNLSTGKRENLNPKAKFYQIDICDPKIAEIFEKERPDYVNHHAAQINVRKSIEDPMFDAKINIEGLLNILENCRKFNVKKVIFPSSGGTVYGETDEVPSIEKTRLKPISPYAITKVTGEYYLHYYWKVYAVPYSILRYGNVYGPRQDAKGEAGVIAIFTEKMLVEEQPIINGDGLQTRDYIYISDVVKANLQLMQAENSDIYNVGNGKEVNVIEIFDKVKEATGSSASKQFGPPIKGELQRTALNIEKIKKDFSWNPEVELTEGMRKVVEWYKNNNL